MFSKSFNLTLLISLLKEERASAGPEPSARTVIYKLSLTLTFSFWQVIPLPVSDCDRKFSLNKVEIKSVKEKP
jgi:hypothetical protein